MWQFCRDRSSFVALVLVLVMGRPAQGQDGSPDFARDIQPILEKHCGRCHGADKDRAGLRLHSRDAAHIGREEGESRASHRAGQQQR